MATRPTTITTPVSDRPVADADALLPWANKEIIPLARELRSAANQRAQAFYTVDTEAVGAFGTLWTSAMPINTVWFVTARVTGISKSGAAQQYAYTLESLFYSDGSGVMSQVGATSALTTIESDAAAQCLLRISGGQPILQVADNGVSPTTWVGQVSILSSMES